MQKTKFKIKGMRCHSCVTLIEKELSEQPGIISASVNLDSQKGVVIYDENRIREADIFRLVEGVSDYRVEKMADDKDDNKKEMVSIRNRQFQENKTKQPSSKFYFFFGAVSGFAVLSLIMNVIFINSLINLSAGKTTSAQDEIVQGPNPSPSLPPSVPEAPAAIQSFEITKADHIRGDFNAPITLVEFSDFECPFCRRHNSTMNKILNDYKGRVRLVYKHFPLEFHPNAQKAAEASECADEQGKFWEYHDKLFDNLQLGYSLENFKQWAKEIGLKSGQFNNCLDSGKYAQKVQAEYQEGVSKGVNGTPATFVNGQLVSGALPYESFKQIIDNLLANL